MNPFIRNIRRLFFYLFFLLAGVEFCKGIDPSVLYYQYITQLDGLSNGNVNTICQDYKGFIWIGTKDGINRYDGFKIEVYKSSPGDSGGLPDNEIIKIFEDSKKRLWIGTRKGLAYYDRGQKRIRTFENNNYSLINEYISSINEDSEGRIWFGTLKGLYSYNSAKGEVIKIDFYPEELDNNTNFEVGAIEFDSRGKMWIGSFNIGLAKYDLEKNNLQWIYRRKDLPDPTEKDVISRICVDKNNNIWFSNGRSEIFKTKLLTEVTERVYLRGDVNEKNNCQGIFCDSNGVIWIAEGTNGLFFYSKENSFINIKASSPGSSSLLSNKITTIFQDNEGIYWVGHHFKGVTMIVPDYYQSFYTLRNPIETNIGLNYNLITSITEDHIGNIWFGSDDGGLYRYIRSETDMYTLQTIL
ncbi:MAG: hypothetical protein HC906_18225 [Bacteroidales bacterium]|nr:hypothetical protein [Bacteroidales bacterium]